MKRQAGRILSRKKVVRKALLISIARALAQNGKSQTTAAKAREISPLFERLITKAKQDTLATRRELLRYFDTTLVRKMVEEIGPRYRDRQGGYTRITKIAVRKSDGSKMAIIELIT